MTPFRSRGRRSKPSSRAASPTRSSSSASQSNHSCASMPSSPATPASGAKVGLRGEALPSLWKLAGLQNPDEELQEVLGGGRLGLGEGSRGVQVGWGWDAAGQVWFPGQPWIPVARQEGPQRSPCGRRLLVLEAGLWCQEEASTPHLSFPTPSLFHHLLGFFPLF